MKIQLDVTVKSREEAIDVAETFHIAMLNEVESEDIVVNGRVVGKFEVLKPSNG